MSAHSFAYNWHQAEAAGYMTAKDPGDAGTLTVKLRTPTRCAIVTAAAETRTLASPLNPGQLLFLYAQTIVTSCTVTVTNGYDGVGSTTLIFDRAGDYVSLYSIRVGSALRWRILSSSGISGPLFQDTIDEIGVHRVFDHFIGGLASTREHFITIDDAGTGTNALRTDVAGGVLNVVTAAADNDYHAMATSIGAFDFLSAKEAWFEIRLRCAEATTNDSAYWFGVTSDLTTGGLQANAAGPLATYDGFMIWKDEDTMILQAETSNAAGQDTEATVATVVTNTWHTFAMHVSGAATTAIATAYYDLAGGRDFTASSPMNLTRAGLVPGALVFGIKAGPGAAAETLQVDYVLGCQVR